MPLKVQVVPLELGMVLELALELGVEVQVVPLELGLVLELSELALEQPKKLLPQQHEGKLEELEEMAVGQAEGKEVEP